MLHCDKGDIIDTIIFLSINALNLYLELFFRKDAFFVDLFVRMSNNVAVDMYKQLGYVIYRRVLEYYSGDPDEDAFGKNSISNLKFTLKMVLSFMQETKS